MFARITTLGLAIALCLSAAGAPPWKIARSEHFELYSQAGQDRATALLGWLEQLRAFFLTQSVIPALHLPAVDLPPARVVLFASPKEYEPYGPRALSDGYYASSEGRHYIALAVGTDQRRIAAHEFAHLALDAGGLKVPSWLAEGLAEFFSTVRIDAGAAELGSEPPGYSEALTRRPWIPLSALFSAGRNSPVWDDRSSAGLFYAQSWALADMLLLSPGYAPRFQSLLAAIGAGTPVPQVFAGTFGKSTAEVESDLHGWIAGHSGKIITQPGAALPPLPADSSAVSDFTARSVLADMLAAGGELDRAEALLRDLARETPNSAGVSVALGTIALRKGDKDGARREWKRAIDQGSADADIFYRYALLADQAGLPSGDIRAALERAVALRPDFDDARYRLGLLEKNAAHYDAAVQQFRAMRTVAPARAFSYWTAMSDALNELGERDESLAAAQKAARYARTQPEKTLAAQLAYFAQTDLTVQLAPDSSGRPQMVTARVPHQSAADWNPFVEAGDDLRTVRGMLLEIVCDAVTEIRIDSGGGTLTLAIPDPSRVQMRNAPAEFVCGPQQNVELKVQYAASKEKASDGLVRGIEFLR